ncbi:MAG: hypothetical protein HOO06_04290 [Bdellovibrionaceae bacterium]|nr:hypothetical protein [Pseudobdellovibrionaceae bacterium]
MDSQQGVITQSKYYSPIFDVAVFDGPFRIYFSQNQETVALKTYYRIKKNLEFQFSEKVLQQNQNVLFLMIYPDKESFSAVFNESQDNIGVGKVGDRHVVGVYREHDEEDIETKLSQVLISMVKSWNLAAPAANNDDILGL